MSYPKKTGKLDAQRAWKKAQLPPLHEVLQAVEVAKRSDAWHRGYIPNPATWLNEGRWLDEPMKANGHARQAPNPPFPGPEDPIGRNQWRQAYGDPNDPQRTR